MPYPGVDPVPSAATTLRRLTSAEEEAGYDVLIQTVAWLRERDFDLWQTPLDRDEYRERHVPGDRPMETAAALPLNATAASDHKVPVSPTIEVA